MLNKTTYIERISARLLVVESILKRLEPVDELLARVAELEDKVYTTKSIFTFTEACTYLGISKSLLYKLTGSKEVPYYKPRGKMLYFVKEELDEWLKRNAIPILGDVIYNGDGFHHGHEQDEVSCKTKAENDAE